MSIFWYNMKVQKYNYYLKYKFKTNYIILYLIKYTIIDI